MIRVQSSKVPAGRTELGDDGEVAGSHNFVEVGLADTSAAVTPSDTQAEARRAQSSEGCAHSPSTVGHSKNDPRAVEGIEKDFEDLRGKKDVDWIAAFVTPADPKLRILPML